MLNRQRFLCRFFLLQLFLIKCLEVLEVVLLDLASESLVASGAHKVFGIYRAVKADDLTARGALYLVEFLVLTAIAAVLVTAVAAITFAADAGLEAFALVAISVAVTVVAVAVAVASVTVTAIAIVVVTVTAVALVHLVHQIFLDLAEVVVELLCVIVEGVDLLVDVLKLCAELARELDESRDELALGLCGVKVESLGQSLYVCNLFVKCHFLFLRIYFVGWF